MLDAVIWKDDFVAMLDQRLLPGREEYLSLRTPEEIAEGIRGMAVRGAPAIGISAAMGLALTARQSVDLDAAAFRSRFADACRFLSETRPTAINLFWAIERMRGVLEASADPAGLDSASARRAVADALVREALLIKEEDIAACRRMGRFGAELVPESARIMTHCNAGALATGGYGTALGVIRAATEAGKKVSVIANETRPYLQGSRLTAWEMMKDAILTTLITDSMAGHLMKTNQVDLVVVGSDRIVANGDVANKIGTYTVAVLAKENNVPFYVAAPVSTIDLDTPDGDHIPIEERDPSEVTHVRGELMAPAGVGVANYAFDVTPNRYVAAIITENGIARPPYIESLRAIVSGRQKSSGGT